VERLRKESGRISPLDDWQIHVRDITGVLSGKNEVEGSGVRIRDFLQLMLLGPKMMN